MGHVIDEVVFHLTKFLLPIGIPCDEIEETR
jgi:hypothetical protein